MSRCACLKRTIYVSIHASFRDSTMNEFCSRARQLYASVQRERRPYKCTCLFRLVVASGESVHRNLGKKYFPTRETSFFSFFTGSQNSNNISRDFNFSSYVIFIQCNYIALYAKLITRIRFYSQNG